MTIPLATSFASVQAEGGLLPPDLLQRIANGDRDLGHVDPSSYGYKSQAELREAIASAWSRALRHWAALRGELAARSERESVVTETREQWMLPLLRALGHDPQFDRAPEQIGDHAYPISHRADGLPIHIVSARHDLNKSDPGASQARRISPHGLVQEYLNRADAALYGLVTNGLELRLLRDNQSLTRAAYVAFDLEQMLDGVLYADFTLLWLCLHRSRFPQPGAELGACVLEEWRKKADDLGTRAMGALRPGVRAALIALGEGVLAHPANKALCASLRDGRLTETDLYAELLRLLYRLLFLLVAEQRDLLFVDGTPSAVVGRYERHYSLTRLRAIARRHLDDDRHDDLWRGVRLVFDVLAGRRGGLGLSPLGGGLFDAASCPHLDGAIEAAEPAAIANGYVARAIGALTRVRIGQRWRPVNYRDLDVEELGGVYEGLLDEQARVVADEDHAAFELIDSSQRKQTGSYYTPTPLVRELIRSALDPVIEARLAEAKTPAARRAALLSITVVDSAAGSGHFLLAAARRLGEELARIDAGDREPSPGERRAALREVIRTCIHGVDVNPLAVDLCRLSLWIEGHEAGKPLTFLDHRIQQGNSLIGARHDLIEKGLPEEAFNPIADDDRPTASRLKRRNRDELKALAAGDRVQGRLAFGEQDWGRFVSETLVSGARAIAQPTEDTLAGVRAQAAAYAEFAENTLEGARAIHDAWTAAFVWPLRPDAPEPPTTADLAVGPGRRPRLSEAQWRTVAAARARHTFFHWELAFPEVFAHGGFDCVLGNPPWERIKLQEQEFFAERDPAIAGAPNKAARQRLIDTLAQTNPGLAAAFGQAKRAAESQSKFARASQRFSLSAVGDVNLYALFAEHNRDLVSRRGRVGMIVPTGIATDDSTKAFFQDVVDRAGLAGLLDFENRKVFFSAVHASYKFCLLILSGAPVARGDFAFFCTDVEQLKDPRRRFQLSPEDFARLNPNTRTCPVFRTSVDADLTRAIYRRVPVLIDERTGANPWGVTFQTMFHMSNDSHLFHTAPGPGRVPLYEAKLFHQFNHRWATYAPGDARIPSNAADREFLDGEDEPDIAPAEPALLLPGSSSLLPLGEGQDEGVLAADPGAGDSNESDAEDHGLGEADGRETGSRGRRPNRDNDPTSRTLTSVELADPTYRVTPRYWVSATEVEAKLKDRWGRGWLLSFRDIARATDERTAIFSVLPRVAAGHKAPLIFLDAEPRVAAAFLGAFNGLAFDFAARQKVGGTNLAFFTLKQLPMLAPSAYTAVDLEFIVPRVLELTYTAWDLQAFAQDLGHHGPPFAWDEARRAILRAELDAYYAALYGLTRDELRYILDPQDVYGPDFPGETFRVLKEGELRRYGEYRTRRLVLEAWDGLGLAPRNRDGRYDAGASSTLAASIAPATAPSPIQAKQPPTPDQTAAPAPERPSWASREPTVRSPSIEAQSAGSSPTTRSAMAERPSSTSGVPTVGPRPIQAESQSSPPDRATSDTIQPKLAQSAATSPQSILPGLPPTSGDTLRQRILSRALDTLRQTGPLSARELAARLAPLDSTINWHLVNSVLFSEGKAHVRRDQATGRYRIG
ncbi:MAG: hypothetical protein EPO26_13400 [Chloroflexota bacterium]|nr:MAG: hypothetical protein EPO26_13400 [Chloroflexota bacterium]